MEGENQRSTKEFVATEFKPKTLLQAMQERRQMLIQELAEMNSRITELEKDPVLVQILEKWKHQLYY